MNVPQFNHSLSKEHLDYFQFWAIMNKAAIRHSCIGFITYIFISFLSDKCQGVPYIIVLNIPLHTFETTSDSVNNFCLTFRHTVEIQEKESSLYLPVFLLNHVLSSFLMFRGSSISFLLREFLLAVLIE